MSMVKSRLDQNACPLPPEIIDYVIDFLHEDKPDLRSCSLVARAFSASSQLHLFHSLRLEWNYMLGLGFAYIVPFFHEHLHPSLRSYIRNVHICQNPPPSPHLYVSPFTCFRPHLCQPRV
ncbi:hypothetical protein QCA50_008462 [Cerrena zonata]|uniref:F-box domain-containing protein n=1 Tax=Cerrena zonata TaxID=2478898 RepID=A0AAW0GDW3_9APHY